MRTIPGESAKACTLGYSAGRSSISDVACHPRRKERTEDDELDQAIHRMLRDVHIAGSWNANLGPTRGGGHEISTALFESGRRGASEYRVRISHVTDPN